MRLRAMLFVDHALQARDFGGEAPFPRVKITPCPLVVRELEQIDPLLP